MKTFGKCAASVSPLTAANAGARAECGLQSMKWSLFFEDFQACTQAKDVCNNEA